MSRLDIFGHRWEFPEFTDPLCATRPDLPWVPNGTAVTRGTLEAKRLCMRCTHMDDCAAWAMANYEHGVWGGLDTDQRQAMRDAQRRARGREQG